MATLNAGELAAEVNAYSIKHNPNTITIPNARRLAAYHDVTVSGILIGRQLTHIQADGSSRTFTTPQKGGTQYDLQSDGDVHCCLGTKDGQVHVACELQNATDWLATINAWIGKPITVSGFFRCLFEHPGFAAAADAHIFEIHPVRAITFGQDIQPFDVDRPEPQSIYPWKTPNRDLSAEDANIHVKYNNARDELTFTNMRGMDLNYVQVAGRVKQIQLGAQSNQPSQFNFEAKDIGHTVQAYCLKGTSASLQLKQLKEGSNINLVALRNIDLLKAQANQYVINLLAIDIQQV